MTTNNNSTFIYFKTTGKSYHRQQGIANLTSYLEKHYPATVSPQGAEGVYRVEVLAMDQVDKVRDLLVRYGLEIESGEGKRRR